MTIECVFRRAKYCLRWHKLRKHKAERNEGQTTGVSNLYFTKTFYRKKLAL